MSESPTLNRFDLLIPIAGILIPVMLAMLGATWFLSESLARKSDIEAIKSDIESLARKSDIMEIDGEIREIRSDIHQLDAEIKSGIRQLSGRIGDLERFDAGIKSDIRQLNERIRNLEQSVKGIEAQLQVPDFASNDGLNLEAIPSELVPPEGEGESKRGTSG